MNLRQLLGCVEKKEEMSEWEIMARNLVRQLSLMGYGAYETWEITSEMERLSLSAQEHPDLFPPNQRPPKLKAFYVR